MPIQNIVSTTFPFGVPTDDFGTFKSTSLFWDGRQKNVVSMVLEPIQNHIEMGISDLDGLMKKIRTIPDYKPLFESAFGNTMINKDRVSMALGAFVVSIKSTNTHFDLAVSGADFFTFDELQGFQLFFDKYNCNSCHQVQRPFNGYQFAETDSVPDGGGPVAVQQLVGFADIGLEQSPIDIGAEHSTGNPADKGKFKIASLRNVVLTAPYMHDGRFQTLDDVLDHYSHGIKDSPNLDPNLRDSNGMPKRLNISDVEKQQIIAFLASMTDYSLLSDYRFANPFRVR